MKRARLLILSAVAGIMCIAAGCSSDNTNIVIPSDKQIEWAEAEIGVIIHLDMPTFVPEYDFTAFGTHPDAATFNPKELDTDQWLETADKLGAKYAVLVAKHCSGFSLWPTQAHEYSVKNSPWRDGKGDIVADFIKSCKKYGIKPGIYASTPANGFLHVNKHQVDENGPVDQKGYNDIVLKQLTELWSNYGELFEIWFDGGVLATEKGGADIMPLIKKLQPEAVIFQGPYGHKNLVRWVGNEEGVAPYPCWATADSTTRADGTKVINGLNGSPDAPFWCPGESDFTLRWNSAFQGGWFWKAGEDSLMFSVQQLLTKYETSVGRNTNMLLGIVIDNRGLVPDADVKRIEEAGAEIRRQYGTPLKSTSGKGSELTIELDSPTSVNRVVIQENIAKGERVLQYNLLGLSNGEWHMLAQGSNIGHKRIERFIPVTVEAVKLDVVTSKATPDISNFAVFTTIE